MQHFLLSMSLWIQRNRRAIDCSLVSTPSQDLTIRDSLRNSTPTPESVRLSTTTPLTLLQSLSLARGLSHLSRRGVRCLSSPRGRYVMALTTDQQRLRRQWREKTPVTVVAAKEPASLVVANLLSGTRREETDLSVANLRELEAELDAVEAAVAQEELSGMAQNEFRCGGCGVQLQTSSPNDLGFIDPKLLADAIAATVTPATNKRSVATPTDALREDSLVCRRCLSLSSSFSSSSLPPPCPDAAWDSAINAIDALPAATVLLVADMTDLDASLPPDLFPRLPGKDVVLVGNKVDALLPDRSGFQDRWRGALRTTAMRKCGLTRRQLRGVELISARSGYGLEQLVTVLTNPDLLKQPVFILGCVNAGKSSLFNRLRSSDLCKAVARPHVHVATESLFPGTTLSLLRFPLVTMTTSQRRRRFARLRETWRKERERSSNFFDPLSGEVGMTFEADSGTVMDQHQGFTRLPTYTDGEVGTVASDYTAAVVQERYLHHEPYDERRLSARRWCYDTPGYLHPQQLTNLLSLEEIAALRGSHSRLRYLPRTLVVRPGRSLLLGGIARVDVVQAPSSLLLTALTNLPLHILPSSDADAYIRDLGKDLRVPDPSINRPRPLPPPTPRHIPLHLPVSGELQEQEAAVDVVFAGVGWVAVTVPPSARRVVNEDEEAEVELTAHFPEGMLCETRRPLLPFCVRQRGRRVGSTLEYRRPEDMMARRFVDSGRRRGRK